MFCLETTFTLDYLIGLIYTLHPYKQILLIMKTIEIYIRMHGTMNIIYV